MKKTYYTIPIYLFFSFFLFFLIVENIALLRTEKSHLVYTDGLALKFPKLSKNIDLYSNNSLHKYVSEDTRVPKDYIPANLKQIENKYIKQSKQTEHKLRREARNGLYELAKAFHKQFDKYIYLNSSYRPWTHQYYLLKEGCSNIRCASIGASEHQLGLAIDIAVVDTKRKRIALHGKYFNRMKENAYKYGYINTYKKGYTIDGRMNEPRHWRYVGIKLAQYLKHKELSFAEFYLLNKKDVLKNTK